MNRRIGCKGESTQHDKTTRRIRNQSAFNPQCLFARQPPTGKTAENKKNSRDWAENAIGCSPVKFHFNYMKMWMKSIRAGSGRLLTAACLLFTRPTRHLARHTIPTSLSSYSYSSKFNSISLFSYYYHCHRHYRFAC